MNDPKTEALLRHKLIEIFDRGWRVGRYEGRNEPIDISTLQRKTSEQWEDRDRLIREVLELVQKSPSL